ncbi:sialidase family protein [Flavihumibacter sp. CACIAM 22H1]|uniref:sialidase family protein n=1 Tax=Flavihumibacter sp. CACIAM 22H1 TaxID=1812911 RepID=UPI0007A9115A|nr:sialidase family protein [Flavihumibacter sp. CACIAM 22H1]KYP13383.1 MAG: exo-alpha-sialidase [Flavihumibacter sp. CACIAM 22H1]
MNKRKGLLPVLLLISAGLIAQSSSSVPVFVSGREGHKSYRIPAIIALPNGKLLAFCEGRVDHAGDFGDINIVLKTSTDGGANWSAIQTLVDYDTLQAGNPAPVVDLLDPAYPGGRIFLFYNTGNNHEGEVRKGHGLREVWYISSTDGGSSWSPPVNITLQTHRPNQPAINPAYSFREDWRSYANTPGHAMQFQTGNFKGRIFVAANHSSGNPQEQSEDYQAHGFYTDDHGRTFKLGETISIPGSNESTAAELTGGKLMLNARNQKGDIRSRIVATSSTGGATWDSTYFDPQLPDPVCQGSLLTIGKKKKNNLLAFCNAADTKKRDKLTLRISYDDGKTWTKAFLVDQGENPRESDPTAYSDIVLVNRKTIGVLYEKHGYSSIVFRSVRWK